MGKCQGGGDGGALGGQSGGVAVLPPFVRRPFRFICPIVVHQLLFSLSFSTVTAYPADLSWPTNNNLWPNGNEFGDGDGMNGVGGGGAFSPFAFPQKDIGNAETNAPLTFLAGSANSAAGHFGTSDGDGAGGTDFDSVLDAFEANGKNSFGAGNQFEWAGNREEETDFTRFPTLIPADLSMMRSIPVFGTYGRGTAVTGTGDDGIGIGIGTFGNEKSPRAGWRQANCFTAGGCVDQLPNNHQHQATVASSALIGGGAAAAASYLGGNDGTTSYKFPMIEEAAVEETLAGRLAQERRQGNTYGGFMGGNAEVDGTSPMYPLGAANAFGGFAGEGATGGMFAGIGATNTDGGVEESAEDWDDDLMAGGGGGAMALGGGGGGNGVPWIAGGAETRRTDSEERQRYGQYLESIHQRYGVMLPRGGNNAPQQPFGNNPFNGDGSAALPPQPMSSVYSGISPQGMSVDGTGTPNQRGPMPSNVWPVSSSRQVGTSANILSPRVPSPPASASFGTFSSATNHNPFIAGSAAVDGMGCAESARTKSLIMDNGVPLDHDKCPRGEEGSGIGAVAAATAAGVQPMPQQRNGGGPNYGSIISDYDGTFAAGNNHPAWPSGMALIAPTGQNGIWRIAGEGTTMETDGVQQQSQQQQQSFLLEQSLLLALLTTRSPASSQATVTVPTQQTTTTTTAQPMTTSSTTTTTTTTTTSTTTDQERMERTPPIQQSTTSVQALSQQIRRLPAVLYADSRKSDSRQLEVLMRDTYGLPLVTFYADKLGRTEAVEANLAKLTAHRGMPYLFICGTFIGSLEHIQNYHQQRQMPRLVEYVCSGEADKGDGIAEESTRMTDKRRAGRKRRRESKKWRKGKKRKENNNNNRRKRTD
ncbi:hypothetical protein GPALN_006442 [Globodera pallida]|nr:hypothetical protein GPALN_006442 [Globodera pallida]